MDARHFDVALISMGLSAVLGGVTAAGTAIPATGSIDWTLVAAVAGTSLVGTLTAGLKHLYTASPNQVDTLSKFTEDVAHGLPILMSLMEKVLPKPTVYGTVTGHAPVPVAPPVPVVADPLPAVSTDVKTA